jgi:hypothetical protein
VQRYKLLLANWRKWYTVDVRSLGLMRIAVGCIVLADLLIRAQDIDAFFTDDGLMPRHLLKNFGWQPGYWSFHTLYGSHLFITCLFILHGIFALTMLAGYRTRLFTFLVWIFTVSLHNRNLFILQSGDDLLRLTLFWGIFLPWGHALSLDAKKYRSKIKYGGLAVFGYYMLIVSVYVFTVFFKNSSEWRTEGSAIYYALSLDQIRLPLGDLLYHYPGVMIFLTYLVYFIEIAIPLLLLLSVKLFNTRGLAVILLFLLHIGIGLTLYVGLFFVINMATALAFVPGAWLSFIRSENTNSYSRLPWRKSNLIFQIIESSFSAFVISICLILNLSFMNWFQYELVNQFSTLVNVLRLNQYWGMFSPHIMKEDGWLVHEGYTEEGKHWDLKKNQAIIDIHKPEHLVKDYKSDRWRKFAENMQRDNYTFLRPLYCKYHLKKWNKEHPDFKMKSLDLIFFEEVSEANYKTKTVERKLFCLCVDYD